MQHGTVKDATWTVKDVTWTVKDVTWTERCSMDRMDNMEGVKDVRM